MGRKPCCEEAGIKKGPWSYEEDKTLINFIFTYGHCCWRILPKLAGLKRCGKSCRLRWTNYLRPGLKRGLLSESEENLVIHLHAQFGNKWSKIASNLPGRTDNEIKNQWNTRIKKKLRRMGIDPLTHIPLLPPIDEQQDGKKENDISMEYASSTNEYSKDEEDRNFSTTIPSPLMEFNIISDVCIDEIPLMEPHEILAHSDSSPSTASSLSSSFNKNYDDHNNNNKSLDKVEEMAESFDWHCDYTNEMGYWDFDYDLDVLINGHSGNNVISAEQPPPSQVTTSNMVGI